MRRSSSSEALLAPSAPAAAPAFRLPGAATPLPPIDEHLVTPEVTREEIVRGERMLAQPALPPHGDRHFRLDFVLGGHVRPEYVGSTDLLSRFAFGSDFASDTCIRKDGEDPATGARYLEEIAFEVVYTQPLKKATARAEDMIRRGVRRVFGIFVKTGTVKEWMPRTKVWQTLDKDSEISDRCLVRPVPVRALLDAAASEDAVAGALEAKDNPVILQIKAKSKEQGVTLGELRGLATAVLQVLESRGLAVPNHVRATVQGSRDPAELLRWLGRAAVVATAEEAIAAAS